MEKLPENIEKAIERLPIVNFDQNDELQKVVMSQDFNDIFQYYTRGGLPEILINKPVIYQRLSLYLSLTGQGDKFVEDTDQAIFRRRCPDIHTFLTDNYYMGYSNATLYPYWKEKLEYIFRDNSPIRKVVFGGCIGAGKSTIARKAFVYTLYRLLCLRYPRAVLNVDGDATLMAMIISMTLQQVYETNLLPFIKLLETMPCFQKVLSQRSFDNFDLSNEKCPIPFVVEKSSNTIHFPDNIIIGCGSGISHTIGKNLFTTFCDEMNEKSVQDALTLLNSVDNRFSSRFEGSDFIFQSIVSSARDTNSALDEYLRKLPKGDPKLLKLSPMLWEVKPDPEFIGDGSTFPVLVGNGTIQSKLITNPGELTALEKDEYIIPTGCSLIYVPMPYKAQFELQLDQSIQDIAGMTTSDNNMVFRDVSKLEDTELIEECCLEVNVGENTNIFDLLPIDRIFRRNLLDKWQLIRAPDVMRYIHIDLAAGGFNGTKGACDAAVCILHKEYIINPVTNQQTCVFIVDLILAINAKTKIDIQAILQFCIDLVKVYNVKVHTISTDQWQSLIFRQNLEQSGYFANVEKLSVDLTLEPYTNAVRLTELGLVKVGKCDKLKRELLGLTIVKNKVTKNVELKDMADALVGSIFSAQMNYSDLPKIQYLSEHERKKQEQIQTYHNKHGFTNDIVLKEVSF